MTKEKDNTRFQKFAGNKTYDGSEIPEGHVLVPVVMQAEDLQKDTVIKENLTTWKLPNFLGEMVNVVVGFVAVPIELFDAMLSIFNAQERDYVNDKHMKSCADVSMDKLKEDMENSDKKVVDIIGTTREEEQYNAETQMIEFINGVRKENPMEANMLEEKWNEDKKTQEKLAKEYFPGLGRSQGSKKVGEILKTRVSEYHELYDDK